VSGVQALVLDFCHNELRDDMTMLVIRVGEPPGRSPPGAGHVLPGAPVTTNEGWHGAGRKGGGGRHVAA
jgi:hypothetical protein